MKKDIHPTYYPNAKIICACGNSFTAGSTQKELKIELCSMCHPFYTGKQKLVDTAKRVEKFQARVEAKKKIAVAGRSKKVKRAARAKERNRKTTSGKTDTTKKTSKK